MQRFSDSVKRLVFGAPIPTDLARSVTMRTRLALPVFGAGVLASIMYGPDALIDSLRSGSKVDAAPIMAAGTVLILLLLGLAYSLQVRTFPHERGDYGIVRDKLGPSWGMITGASLLVDYLFTVAISVAAIAEVVTYLIPRAHNWTVAIAVAALAAMALGHLRGMRDRSRVLIVVWTAFLVAIAATAAFGLVRSPGVPEQQTGGDAWSWTVLVAYAGAVASGAVMVTGIEHLAASGPYHAEPRGRRASRTLLIAVVAGALGFFAITWLAWSYGLSGWKHGSLALQVVDAAVPWTGAVWVLGAAAIGILYAASTSVYRRFSRLTGLLATDGVLPRQMSMRNDRLVQRGSVLLVAGLATAIVIASGASVERLVHMYIIGVFTAIVLTQLAMVAVTGGKLALATQTGERVALWARRVTHLTALVVAAAVLLVTAIFNFANGAWIAIVLIVVLVVLMHGIRRHYEAVRADIALGKDALAPTLPSATHGIVLVAQLHRPALHALSYAKAARHSTLKAVTVQMDKGASTALEKRWTTLNVGVPLVVLDSPYRDLVGPMLAYVKGLHMASPREAVYVYVPEYIVGRWWEQLLHNRNTARLRAQLLNVPNVVVSAVPWMLESARREGPMDNLWLEDVELP